MGLSRKQGIKALRHGRFKSMFEAQASKSIERYEWADNRRLPLGVSGKLRKDFLKKNGLKRTEDPDMAERKAIWEAQAAKVSETRKRFKEDYPLWPKGGRGKALANYNKLGRQEQKTVDQLLKLARGENDSGVSGVSGRFDRGRGMQSFGSQKRDFGRLTLSGPTVHQGERPQEALL
jgi:hypothetical protein